MTIPKDTNRTVVDAAVNDIKAVCLRHANELCRGLSMLTRTAMAERLADLAASSLQEDRCG